MRITLSHIPSLFPSQLLFRSRTLLLTLSSLDWTSGCPQPCSWSKNLHTLHSAYCLFSWRRSNSQLPLCLLCETSNKRSLRHPCSVMDVVSPLTSFPMMCASGWASETLFPCFFFIFMDTMLNGHGQSWDTPNYLARLIWKQVCILNEYFLNIGGRGGESATALWGTRSNWDLANIQIVRKLLVIKWLECRFKDKKNPKPTESKIKNPLPIRI